MIKHFKYTILLLGFNISLAQQNLDSQVEQEYFTTLSELCEALLKQQNTDKNSPEYGGLLDPENDIYYTRAAEALYPFVVIYQYTKDKKYLKAAINLGNWLITKQEETGEWIENPWQWTGTTADQLLMMAAAYPELEKHLSAEEKGNWEASMRIAGMYLVKKMEPDFASINYVPTTAGTMAMLWKNVIQEDIFKEKAKKLAWQTIAKMDSDQFIHGEAARVHGVKYGVDLSYQMDMSLWGLTLYARITGDQEVEDYVRKSLAKVIHFVYPNGIIDGSWGARSYKWTGYGTKTADGSQILFSLFANENSAYQTAALRNLEYLRKAIKGGLVGYGRDLWAFGSKTGKPNLYPTFARAKNLALALEYGKHQKGKTNPIPADQGDWVKFFPTIKVATLRKGDWMATVSSYDYHDYTGWGKDKYRHFPRGGAMLNLWLKDFGMVTTASQAQYVRGETIHMPPIEDSLRSLTPRIEFRNENGYFTNLYDTKSHIHINKQPNAIQINTSGELSDQEFLPGGVAYMYDYTITNKSLTKKVTVRYHDRKPEVQIVEPIVLNEGVEVTQVDKKTVKITSPNRNLLFKINQGNVTIEVGKDVDKYWFPFPGLYTYPIIMKVKTPKEGFQQVVSYTYSVAE
ncbi:hypothetical protein J8281_04575 [Aquimarina sp. U1-2]|uniref:hypothetical protein n=1 Tax=Aquimarina sp. U1-2 TaxID=2823141 RepID=UPI001AECFC86|nr:hypothetical protein [Aquimarina sp. U1-2]MBP2831456.1 hypothetical protein [Aquimarina sp. U1-2]